MRAAMKYKVVSLVVIYFKVIVQAVQHVHK